MFAYARIRVRDIVEFALFAEGDDLRKRRGGNELGKYGRSLIYLVGVAILIFNNASLAAAFDTFEHFYVGQVAYQEALKQVCPNNEKCKGPLKFENLFKDPSLSDSADLVCEKPGPSFWTEVWQPVAQTSNKIYVGADKVADIAGIKALFVKANETELNMAERAKDAIPVGFGDLSALAGDFTKDPNQLSQDIRRMKDPQTKGDVALLVATRQHLVGACQWLGPQKEKDDDKHCHPQNADEDNWCSCILSNRDTHSEGTKYTMSRAEAAAFEAIPGYVGLASQNKEHFPTHSWKKYKDCHAKALGQAKLGGQAALEDAIIYEGFAQHFLQDSFASGHIGSKWGYFLLPDRRTLQTTHDYLNAYGLKVENCEVDGDSFGLDTCTKKYHDTSWMAYGDDSLLLQKAERNREILIAAATQSIVEVLKAAKGDPPTPETAGKLFPVPFRTLAPKQLVQDAPVPVPAPKELAQDPPDPKLGDDLAVWNCPSFPWWNCQSKDFRVPSQPVEGWKVLVSAGLASGTFVQLNSNLRTVNDKRHHVFASAFELGYVRSTSPWSPNYFGAGVEIVDKVRTSFYPLSVGYWITAPSRLYYFGIRANVGVRLEEPFQRANPSPNRESSFETSFPFEFGIDVYPPLALFFRAELLSLDFKNITTSGPFRLETDSVFNRRTVLTWGVRWDLAGVL